MTSDNDLAIARERRYFEAIPWCRELLEAPGISTFLARFPNTGDNLQDRFFSHTINTPTGIPACIGFSGAPAKETNLISEVSTLFSLEKDLNGYPGVVHGGVVAALIDETMGVMIARNMSLELRHPIFDLSTVTGTIELKYTRPVPTPSVIVGTAKIKEINGRKMYVSTVLKDANGMGLATGEAVWLSVSQAMHTKSSL
jgi:acyl-coenzyme A thioesterase PaaI-like protein